MLTPREASPFSFLRNRLGELILLTDVEPAAVYSLIPAIFWTLLLWSPLPILKLDPIYIGFLDHGSQFRWGCLYASLGIWQIVTLFYGKHLSNLVSYLAGVLVWVMTGTLASQHCYHLGIFPIAPDPYFYYLAAGGCTWAVYRKAILHITDWTLKGPRLEAMKTRIRQEIRHDPIQKPLH